jgi:hypothetical protein
MLYGYGPRPDQPSRATDPRPVSRIDDDVTGNAGADGFTRLSRADRETGYRPPAGDMTPVFPRYVED